VQGLGLGHELAVDLAQEAPVRLGDGGPAEGPHAHADPELRVAGEPDEVAQVVGDRLLGGQREPLHLLEARRHDALQAGPGGGVDVLDEGVGVLLDAAEVVEERRRAHAGPPGDLAGAHGRHQVDRRHLGEQRDARVEERLSRGMGASRRHGTSGYGPAG
jgi:hypothetical protein